ncbi:hypothetical protein [Aporhodopirellula aestuarii]|uniref:Uncharacterized protein n=1 Tax=Aporhodopirellula aestuarii TaxID=2950107 RepID=A0ABT0UAT7_9BACT|nr:hypothetical protein [Aporhodopirellula aestuarii]MCM2373979.1 hypothetical protein [Aporhodopirellula aestuarii]
MKKFVLLAIMFAAVAVLGTALAGAANDDSSSSENSAAKSTKQCCQYKSADEDASVAESPKPACCFEAKTQANLAAKTEGCSSESCKAGKQGAGKQAAGTYKHCARDTAAGTSNESLCPAGKAGQCAGKCVSDNEETTVVSTVADVQPCGNCKGACKEECSSCAEARIEAAATEQSISTTAKESGSGMGHGRAGDSQHAKDHQDFFYLIEHRDDIRRTVKNLPNGVETLTESDVEDVASMIQMHVEAMYDRMENANPIRMRDPIFREVFANAKKIQLDIEHTDLGVRVKETSSDPYAVKLVQEHAKVVSLWIKNGYSELPKNHPAPNH